MTAIAPELSPLIGPAPAGPTLRPLPPVSRQLPAVPFALLVFGLLLVGMVGYLVLQTTLQQQAFTLNDLRAEADALSAQESYLEAGLAARTTPQELARAAQTLGMVANPYGTFIDLTSGQVTGVNQVVAGQELPKLNQALANAMAVTSVAAPALTDAATSAVAPATTDSQTGANTANTANQSEEA
ncbi:MAG: hypothetical protein LBL92_06530 [Propionibacteriaceae bacterium]|jgi:hypothetical protein|nr:hypothetical protein [Propionibacteriaceae bacterium]